MMWTDRPIKIEFSHAPVMSSPQMHSDSSP